MRPHQRVWAFGWSQVLGLVPAYWRAEPGRGVWLQGPGLLELVSDFGVAAGSSRFLTQSRTKSRLSRSLCGLLVVSHGLTLLVCRLGPQAVDLPPLLSPLGRGRSVGG